MSARRIREAGFTMVELLIAVTLGLLLTIVIGQVFVNSKEAYRTTEDLSRLQEEARFAVAQLSRVIRMAGYVVNPNADRTSAGTIFPAASRAIVGVDSGTTASDEITVRYQGSGDPTADGTVLDCHGNAIAATAATVAQFHAAARFYIAADASGRNALYCNNTGTLGYPAAAVELAAGVENMQILYGEDTDADGTANRYVLPSAAGFNWDRVVSVRIAILMSSANETASATDTKTYTLLDTNFNPTDDRRIRRVYTTTIALRNRAP